MCVCGLVCVWQRVSTPPSPLVLWWCNGMGILHCSTAWGLSDPAVFWLVRFVREAEWFFSSHTCGVLMSTVSRKCDKCPHDSPYESQLIEIEIYSVWVNKMIFVQVVDYARLAVRGERHNLLSDNALKSRYFPQALQRACMCECKWSSQLLPVSKQNDWKMSEWTFMTFLVYNRQENWKNTNILEWKRGAIHEQDADEDVNLEKQALRVLGTRGRCQCQYTIDENKWFQQWNLYIMSCLLHELLRHQPSADSSRNVPDVGDVSDADSLLLRSSCERQFLGNVGHIWEWMFENSSTVTWQNVFHEES